MRFRYGVRGYIGVPGAGKSYLLAQDAYREHKHGAPVVSNYLNFGRRVKDVDDLLSISDSILALDEAQGWFSARGWSKIPPEVLWRLSQVRHFGISLWFTTQTVDRVDKQLRQITLEWCKCFCYPLARFAGCRTYDNEMHYQSLELRRFEASLATRMYNSWDRGLRLPTWAAFQSGFVERDQLAELRKVVSEMDPLALAKRGIV
jgi:hypothetical protein